MNVRKDLNYLTKLVYLYSVQTLFCKIIQGIVFSIKINKIHFVKEVYNIDFIYNKNVLTNLKSKIFYKN